MQHKRFEFKMMSEQSCGQRGSAQSFILATITAGIIILCMTQNAFANCSQADFDTVVDQAGENLRNYNRKATPKLQAKLGTLKKQKKWQKVKTDAEILERLHDNKLALLDTEANSLLTTIDTLGQTSEAATPDCKQLSELKSASAKLLSVMKTKSDYLIQKIDKEISTASRGSKQTKVARTAPPPEKRPDGAHTTAQEQTNASEGNSASDPTQESTWESVTEPTAAPAQRDDFIALREKGRAPSTPPASSPVINDFEPDRSNGYSIDEIRNATRGFFGTVSTSLASVIEYTFKNWGQPTAYVLGREGGGAFLAGLRYGSGNIYLRNGQTAPIYWHGPSVGYDFGASGDRTMFLIYRLNDPSKIYRRFTGIDGSAYLVGGVGLTLLKGGKVIMAPIRSGLGLRLGANIGYVRFTPRPTWNPF